MSKVAEYFVQISTYRKDIKSTIMKGVVKILARPAKVTTGDNKVENMLLGR